jgi:hypothetical protein
MEHTETAPHLSSPTFGNDVIRLRQWGSDHAYALPTSTEWDVKRSSTWSVGSGEECNLQIHDPTRRTSRRHATLMREHSHWSLLDLGSKNGLYVDGVRQTTALLGAGQEIRFGGVTLIAENAPLIVLRNFLARILGWDGASAERVDVALRAIRSAEVRRLPLLVRGEGDLVPLCAQLHRRILGERRPFVLCDPKRTTTQSTVRSVPNELCVADAIETAQRGTLCLREKRLPPGYRQALAALKTADSLSYLIMCGERPLQDAEADAEPLVICVPPLSQRKHELEIVVHEYLLEAAQALHTNPVVDVETIQWIVEHSAQTLQEIEKGARRLTALAICGTVLRAAELLGMAPVSLRRWTSKRRFPSFITTRDPDLLQHHTP